MFGQVCLAIIILLFLFGSSCILFSIVIEKDNTVKYTLPTKKKITLVEDARLYFDDMKEVLEVDEGRLE